MVYARNTENISVYGNTFERDILYPARTVAGENIKLSDCRIGKIENNIEKEK